MSRDMLAKDPAVCQPQGLARGQERPRPPGPLHRAKAKGGSSLQAPLLFPGNKAGKLAPPGCPEAKAALQEGTGSRRHLGATWLQEAAIPRVLCVYARPGPSGRCLLGFSQTKCNCLFCRESHVPRRKSDLFLKSLSEKTGRSDPKAAPLAPAE